MRRTLMPIALLTVSIASIAFIMRVATPSISSVLAFQSVIPQPVPYPQPPNPVPSVSPYYLSTAKGGMMYCGRQQGSVLLQVPPGFVVGAGADVRCELTDQVSTKVKALGIMDDQGVLIGIYPAPNALLQPLTLIFEVDSAQAARICPACWSVKVYNVVKQSWDKLPAVYDDGTTRVTATITQVLPAAQYAGNPDRALVALFVEAATPTPPPAPTAASTAQVEKPTLAPTALVPTLHPTAALAATSTETKSTANPSSAPNTSDNNNWLFLIVGLLGALIGAGGVILFMRRSK